MPDKTGWDVLRIAQNEGYLNLQELEGNVDKLPVVVLSAVRVSPGRLAEFRPLAYLPKPFPMEALLRMAAEAAQRRDADTQQGSENAANFENPQSNEEELHA